MPGRRAVEFAAVRAAPDLVDNTVFKRRNDKAIDAPPPRAALYTRSSTSSLTTSSIAGHVQNTLRSPKTLSIRPTAGQNL